MKKLVCFLFFALLLFVSSGCLFPVTTEKSPGSSNEPVITGVPGETAVVSFSYVGEDGQIILEEEFEVSKGTNAFEAMRHEMNVDYTQYAFGSMVNSIEGVSAPEGYYLALYVNGEYAMKGISDYIIDEDISIEWKAEKIEDFGLE